MNNRASFPIPLANGTFDQALPGFAPGYHQIVFTYAVKPTAGRMAIFTKTGIDDDWLPVVEAQNLDMATGPDRHSIRGSERLPVRHQWVGRRHGAYRVDLVGS